RPSFVVDGLGKSKPQQELSQVLKNRAIRFHSVRFHSHFLCLVGSAAFCRASSRKTASVNVFVVGIRTVMVWPCILANASGSLKASWIQSQYANFKLAVVHH